MTVSALCEELWAVALTKSGEERLELECLAEDYMELVNAYLEKPTPALEHEMLVAQGMIGQAIERYRGRFYDA